MLNEALTSLQTAYDGLVKADANGNDGHNGSINNNGSNSNNSSNSNNGGNGNHAASVKTGDITAFAPIALLLAASLSAITVITKRKKDLFKIR